MSDPLNTALQTIFDGLPAFSEAEYRDWIAATALDGNDKRNLARSLERLVDPPRLEVLTTSDGNATSLLATIDALSQQMFLDFSVKIGCRRDEEASLRQMLGQRSIARPAIDLVPLDAPDGDVLALEQSVLEAAQGDYVGFLAPGDILPDHAIAEIVLAIARLPDTIVVFTDEDWIDAQGVRSRPRFKNGWDVDAHLGFDLMGRFSPMRRLVALAAGGLPHQAGLAAHYALHCRLAEHAGSSGIVHLPAVLRHAARQPVASAQLAEAYAASSRTVAQQMALRWEGATVVASPAPLAAWFNRIEWPLPDSAPLVSILIPTRDHADLLEASVRGVLEKTDYPALEVLILDNGSVEPETHRLFARLARDPRVRILPMPGPFNYSKLNNDGALAANGTILVLLNNDIEVIGNDWLRELVAHAIRPEIGCVGAKLLYADSSIQHAGVSMAPHTGCAHVGRLMGRYDAGHGGILAIARTHSAVTAACLAIRADVFAEVGGLDEVALRVGYNDVDLCLKVRDHGYRSVCSPFATLFHMESVSRGPNDNPVKQARERIENARIVGRWREIFLDDPNQNPNTLLTWDGRPRLIKSRRAREWESSL